MGMNRRSFMGCGASTSAPAPSEAPAGEAYKTEEPVAPAETTAVEKIDSIKPTQRKKLPVYVKRNSVIEEDLAEPKPATVLAPIPAAVKPADPVIADSVATVAVEEVKEEPARVIPVDELTPS